MRVLLVGNYQLMVKALRKGLEEEGFQVSVAENSLEGLSKALWTHYDAIILDLAGYKGTTLSAVPRFRRAGLRTPLLVLGPPKRSNDQAGVDWLPKPFRLEDLLGWLYAVLGRHEPEVPSTDIAFNTCLYR
jgi:two-component system response regulator MprA